MQQLNIYFFRNPLTNIIISVIITIIKIKGADSLSDTAVIRKQNKATIMEVIRSGGEYTKQQIALKTGLSVATCNTLLNTLADEGQVTGEKHQLNDVGRNTVVYRINEDFDSILCICFELLGGVRRIFTRIISPSGKLISEKIGTVGFIDYNCLCHTVETAINEYPNISAIVIGNPGMSENGIISHCDVPELNGINLYEHLKNDFGLPVSIENDMYFKALGYCMNRIAGEKIITMMNFHANVLPGTATIYKGTVIKGKNSFAGMVGFLPYGITQEQYIDKLNPHECIPFISMAAVSIIAVMNPDEMVFTGNLLNDKNIQNIYSECLESIPEEFMPEFSYLDSFEQCYTMGMYHTAIKMKHI